jgi:hypothetical protein
MAFVKFITLLSHMDAIVGGLIRSPDILATIAKATQITNNKQQTTNGPGDKCKN